MVLSGKCFMTETWVSRPDYLNYCTSTCEYFELSERRGHNVVVLHRKLIYEANMDPTMVCQDLTSTCYSLISKRKLNLIMRSKETSATVIHSGDLVQVGSKNGHDKRGNGLSHRVVSLTINLILPLSLDQMDTKLLLPSKTCQWKSPMTTWKLISWSLLRIDRRNDSIANSIKCFH